MASFFNLGRFGAKQTARTAPQQEATSPLTTDRSLATPNIAGDVKSLSSHAPYKPAVSVAPFADRNMAFDTSDTSHSARQVPFYFREENSTLIVKGNFMTLAAKPTHVDRGEWLAHQIVEQYRLLEGMLKIVQEVDQKSNAPSCNTQVCPQMMAASNTIYTWLDNQKNPIRIPASQYITLVQKWILGKINDSRNFPTENSNIGTAHMSGVSKPTIATPGNSGSNDSGNSSSTVSGGDWVGKTSGFPPNFEHDIKNVYRQMFRCYAHLYYCHWLDPFYHLGLYKELNTCFIHFVNVGKQFDLLMEKDLLPMQPLVDIWLAKDLLPRPSQAQ